VRESDFEMIDMMEKTKVSYQIILTKCDLVDEVDVARRIKLITDAITSRHKFSKVYSRDILVVSAHTLGGVDAIRREMLKDVLEFKKTSR